MKRAVFVLALLVAACASRVVNVAPGTVTGVIADQTGNPLPGVTVTLGTQSAVTDVHGVYAFRNVAPGSYQLTVQLAGFNPSVKKVLVAEGKRARLDAVMKAAATQSITVTAEAPLMGDVANGYTYMAAAAPAPPAKFAVTFRGVEQTTAEYPHLEENGFKDARKESTPRSQSTSTARRTRTSADSSPRTSSRPPTPCASRR